MNKTHLRRSLAALGTAVVCLMVMANPAAAVVHSATITAGQITLTKTGMTPEVIDLAPTGTSTCPSSSITVDFGATSTTALVTALSASSIRGFNGTTGSFLSVLTRSTSGNVAGTITGGTSLSGMRVGVVATIYAAANFNATTCTATGAAACTMALVLNLGGTLTGVSSGNSFSLTGSSVGTLVAFPTCTAGPSYLVGSTATVTSAITGTLA